MAQPITISSAPTSVMDRMGHSLIQTTQKYLHTLPDADQRNLDAFTRITDPNDSATQPN